LQRVPFAAIALFLCARAASAQAYDSGNPTADEQYVLEVINRARANPWAEGRRLGPQGLPNGDITEGLVAPNNQIGVRPPLAMNKILHGTASAHNSDMYVNNYFAHDTPGGLTPGDRMTAAGYIWQKEGENIAEAIGPNGQTNATAAEFEDLLMIDTSEAGRGHRLNLLDAYGGTLATPYFREVGIAYLHENVGNPSGATDFLTQDFGIAQTPNDGPFLLGVIYNDANGNSFYNPGEGISGITVNIANNGGPMLSAFAVSANAGGYVVPIRSLSGNLTITISGGTLSGPFSTTVALTGENVKVDFIIKGSAVTVVTSPTFPPVASSSSKSHHRCGATGMEFVALLAILRALRAIRR
jgi:uncharacterized protein YkwD